VLATLPWPAQLVASLLVTILVEFLVYWAALRAAPARLLLVATLVNACTQPVAVWLLLGPLPRFWAVEALVCLAESAFLTALLRLPYRRALLLSCAANLATALLGLALFG
jgi:hypothetical protein